MLSIANRGTMCSTLVMGDWSYKNFQTFVSSVKKMVDDEYYKKEDNKELRPHATWDSAFKKIVYSAKKHHILDDYSVEQYGHVIATVRTVNNDVLPYFRQLGFQEGPLAYNRKNYTECVLVFTTVDNLLSELSKYDDGGNLIETKVETEANAA